RQHATVSSVGGVKGAVQVATVLGTMSIPHQLDLDATRTALNAFQDAGHSEVDTALMYEGGETEKALG
ncbi:unnamed protein product, partial [Choristocarpus tenellus]